MSPKSRMVRKIPQRRYQASVNRANPFPWRNVAFYFLMLCFSMVLATGAFFAWRFAHEPTAFPIKEVTIQGQLTHVSAADIQKIMQTRLSGGFFSLDVSAAKQAILAMPWVDDVSFRRVWPDKLVVKLKEQQAIARFGKNGVLNPDGMVFYPDINTLPQNLPDLEGPVDQAKDLFGFYLTANALVKLLGLQVVAIHVNGEQSWNLWLSNQVRVTLGHHDALARLKRFVAIYPKITALNQNQMVSVDLRYPNGIAVQYAQTSSKTDGLKKPS